MPGGHAVRELDAILEALDWSEFEQSYDGVRGQPPIHPRHLAAAILYGIICMATDEAKAIYRRRAPVIEGTSGCIKSTMGLRRFLLRGLTKVRMEWLWVCTAFNLRKLLRFLAGRTPDRPGRPIPAQACVRRADPGLTTLCLPVACHLPELTFGTIPFAGSSRGPPWRQLA